MEEHEVPGGAVAIVKDAKLMFARGYGYADVEAANPVVPTSLFRIASISKPITAVAILKLVDEGRLSLDDRVADILDWHPRMQAGQIRDDRLMRITVRQLLQHRGGWDRDRSFDPMFRSRDFAKQLGIPSPPAPREVIDVMLSQPLDFDPGSACVYSNFGYCLLGRMIEERSGQSYERYVQTAVLEPLGIHAMKLGKTKREHAPPGEVRYYDPLLSPSVFNEDGQATVPNPYGGWCLESMDAHGGWISSVIDLARFTIALDQAVPGKPLSRESCQSMYARPEPGQLGDIGGGSSKQDASSELTDPVYYSLGWQNRVIADGKFNRWHSGSLPGTLSILIRRHDGIGMIALLNTRTSPKTRDLGLELDKVLHRAVNAVTEWPDSCLLE